MSLNRDDVFHIAGLCRLRMTDDEARSFQGELSHILEQFAVLDKVDVHGVTPTGHIGDLRNVTRDDQVVTSYSVDAILANVPSKDGDYPRVHAVLEG